MKTPDWMKSSSLKRGASLETVRFESEPPGAEAKTSNGQSCRTPCALALPDNAPLTVTFTLNGYQPETEKIELMSSTTALDDAASPPQLYPNPVTVELTPAAAPPPKPKKVVHSKKTAAKPAPKPARAAAPPQMSPQQPQPQPQQATSPWPIAPSPASR